MSINSSLNVNTGLGNNLETQIQFQDLNTAFGNVSNNINSSINDFLGVSNANSALNESLAENQRAWSAQQAQIAREFNSAQAQMNRDWQERMSNTAHQREVADLVAAGLNPVLSATGGNGASVGSGATASAQNPTGSSATADTSGSSLLGTIFGAMINLINSNNSALTNMAIADKYNAISEIVGDLSSARGLQGSQAIAGGTIKASENALEGSKYTADSGAKNTVIGSNTPQAMLEYGALTGKGNTSAGKVANDFTSATNSAISNSSVGKGFNAWKNLFKYGTIDKTKWK